MLRIEVYADDGQARETMIWLVEVAEPENGPLPFSGAITYDIVGGRVGSVEYAHGSSYRAGYSLNGNITLFEWLPAVP